MISNPSRRIARGLPARRQQGVTLIVALIMLVIIGLASVSVMRSALNSDLVASNSRVQMQAGQAAQLALQYCENDIQGAQTIVWQPAPAVGQPRVWQSFANWYGNNKIASNVPAAVLASANSSYSPAYVPQCLIERAPAGLVNTLYVTARGFSPDYTESSGRTTSGSVVWMQSIVSY
jgi:type IV pilus assembly protein PilX